MSSKPIFYLHIPKTGGQTLAARLASAFPLGRTHTLREELGAEDREQFLKILPENDFIESHVRGDLLNGVSNLEIIATVRDPVSQIISNYRHIYREPRNLWHRAARELSPESFFDTFGDFFTNHQTRYLLSAFFPIGREIERDGMLRTYSRRLYEGLDRIRWLVPTNSINEFIPLWSIENRISVPNRFEDVNRAPNDSIDEKRMRSIVQNREHLYNFDSVLYQATRESFANYASAIQRTILPWEYPNNSIRAFHHDDCGIWLTDNWHPPEFAENRYSWWSGPTTKSEIRFKRKPHHRILSFDVIVVNGIRDSDIEIYSQNESDLNVTLRKRSESAIEFNVVIENFGIDGTLFVTVPQCLSSILVTQNDNDLTRRSFLTTNWCLKSDHDSYG
jgi:Sulfotransferase family